MRYKEFKKEIEDWGKTHSYATEVGFQQFYTYIKIYTGINKEINTIASIGNKYQYVIDTNWVSFNKIKNHARGELFNILVELSKTPIEDRKDEKRFIIPLPHLVTSDNERQYLTHADGTFFASRRRLHLRQTWKEEHLKFVPEIYRQFAEEFDEEKEY